MTADRILELVGRPDGPLADASLWDLEVIESRPLSPSMHRLILTAPGLDRLLYKPGQDLMLRVPAAGERMVNRRYTIRQLDRTMPAVTLDVSLHGAGPGTNWIRAATIGSRIDAIGPRGKIGLRDDADWHLFVTDETGLPGSLSMIEALAPESIAIALFEVDSLADEQYEAGLERSSDIRWLHRMGRSAPGDLPPLLQAVAGLGFPVGRGHAYVAAKTRVVRAIQKSLLERGLDPDQISAKAYWRRGQANADRGEPDPEN